jgi:Tol biopolymer transport system component
MRRYASLTARLYVPLMRSVLLAIAVLTVVLVQAGSAGGGASYREWLTFNEIGLDGGKRVLSRHNVVPETFSLSPDRRQVAYAPYVYGLKSRELWIAEVHRPSERLLLQASGWILGIAWAPNGRTIALSVGDPDSGIWLLERDGSNLRRVGDLGYSPSWSPDSRNLVSMHLVNGHWSISILSLDSGQTQDLGAGQNPQWSPDGRHIVYEKVLGCTCLPEIRVMSVSNGASRRVARGHSPTWSPGALRIAFLRADPAGPPISLWVVNRNGAHRRLIAARVSASYWRPAWSPNARRIAIVKDRAGGCRPSLYVVPVTGGRPKRLARETREILPLGWFSRRRVLYQATRCQS